MSERKFLDKCWRDAKPEDAIKEPPMMARFRDKDTTNWGKPCTLTGWDRGGDLLWSNGSCFWKYCQVYDAPDPGEGHELIDPSLEKKRDGVEYLSTDGVWKPAGLCIEFQETLIYRRRIAPTVTYVPFTWEDVDEFFGRTVVIDGRRPRQFIALDVEVTEDGLLLVNDLSPAMLLDCAKFKDTGKPFGKEVFNEVG